MIKRVIVVAGLLAGIALSSHGVWIYGKAKVAQLLLEMSWRGGVKPWPWADTRPIARLQLERDGARIIVLSGASGRTMAFGPGHLDGSALPGRPGNCVITAHRDTHFAALRHLVPGDVVRVQRTDGRIVPYQVVETGVVGKNETSVLQQDVRTRLTLITCYPFDAILPGGPLRYVVVAEAI